jgi:hypothetical protein
MRTGKARGIVCAGLAVVLASTIQAQAPKSLLGTWKLNAAKSTFSPGPAPKSMSVTYSAVAPDGMKIAVEVVPATGPAEHWEMSGQYDGKDYPIKGNPNADTVSFNKVDDLTSESTFKKAGKVTATNVRKLSADGKTLTVTSTGTTADGKPRKDVQVFEK